MDYYKQQHLRYDGFGAQPPPAHNIYHQQQLQREHNSFYGGVTTIRNLAPTAVPSGSPAAMPGNTRVSVVGINSTNMAALYQGHHQQPLPSHYAATTTATLTSTPTVAERPNKVDNNNNRKKKENESGRKVDWSEFTNNKLVFNRYQVKEVLGVGGFGAVFRAFDTESRQDVALKVDMGEHKMRTLRHEFKVYSELPTGPTTGIAGAHHYGVTVNKADVLVMPLLGECIYDIHRSWRRKDKVLPQKDIFTIAIGMINAIRSTHLAGWVHRDIKPHNFVMNQEHDYIYLVDFGLARRWRDRKTMKHVVERIKDDDGKITGTLRFTGIHTHLLSSASRRDDIECLAHSLIYLAAGRLPWDKITDPDKKIKSDMMREAKFNTTIDSLCSGLHPSYSILLRYARSLKYSEEPDYTFIQDLFRYTPPPQKGLIAAPTPRRTGIPTTKKTRPALVKKKSAPKATGQRSALSPRRPQRDHRTRREPHTSRRSLKREIALRKKTRASSSHSSDYTTCTDSQCSQCDK